MLAPLVLIILALTLRIFQSRINNKGLPFPPGPPPLPLIGSVLSLNTQVPWLTYTEWRAKYGKPLVAGMHMRDSETFLGDIMYIRLLDTDVIVLSSVAIATDLLEKRSGIYSDRPFIATVGP